MSDHGLDGGPAPQLLLDLAVDTAFLAGAIDAQGLWRVVADIALVDIGPFNLDAGERLGFGDDGPQGVAVRRASMEGLGVEHELAAGRDGVGRGDRDLAAKLIRLVGLVFGDALDLGRMQAVELPAPLALLLGADLCGSAQRLGKGLLQGLVALDLAPDVADQPAQAGA